MDIEKLQDQYFKTRFPRASEYEIKKLRKDWNEKELKSGGLLDDFKKRAGDPNSKVVLDIGFGNGLILCAFVNAHAKMYGIEVDELLFNIAETNLKSRKLNAELSLYNGTTFPFADNFFDYVYSTSVLEHTTHPEQVLQEAYRVLKPDGKFYLAFPNKLFPKETHMGLWFISYFPRRLSVFILKIFGRSRLEDWNLHFLSYFSLTRILRLNNINFKVLFETESNNFFKKIIKKILAWFGFHHSAVLPHVMVILQK